MCQSYGVGRGVMLYRCTATEAGEGAEPYLRVNLWGRKKRKHVQGRKPKLRGNQTLAAQLRALCSFFLGSQPVSCTPQETGPLLIPCAEM